MLLTTQTIGIYWMVYLTLTFIGCMVLVFSVASQLSQNVHDQLTNKGDDFGWPIYDEDFNCN